MSQAAGTAVGEKGQDAGLFRGVARHSLVYGLGMIIGRAVGFLMLPIYTRYLTPADYGVIALVEMTIDFITILAGSRLVIGFFHFHHAAATERDRDTAASTSFLLIGALYALVGSVIILLAEPLSQLVFRTGEHATVIRIGAANVAFQSLLIVPLALVRVKDRSMLYVAANLLKLVFALGFNVLFLITLGMGIRGVFLASLTANVLVGGALAVWLGRNAGWAFDAAMARKLLRFGFPLILTSVATFVVTFGNRYFLQAVSDETTVGLYNLAYTFGFLLVMVGFTPMDQAWGPKRFEVARLPNGGELLARGFVLMNVLLLTVATGIGVLVHDVVRLMTAPAFHSAAAVVPVILVAYVLESWAGVQDIGILIREKTRYITLANIYSAIAALAFYVLLIPTYQVWGAAIAGVIAFAVRAAFTYWFSQRLWPVRYHWTPVLVLSAWAALIVVASLPFRDLPIATSLGVRAVLLAAYFVGLWFLPILGDEDRATARRYLRAALARTRQPASSDA